MDKDLWDQMTKFTPLSKMINEDALPNLNKVEENIWVIKDFIKDAERQAYVDYAESLEESKWWEKNKNWWLGKFVVIDEKSPLKELSQTILNRVKPFLNSSIHLGAFGSLHRITEGQGMFIHTDNPTEVRDIYDEFGNKVGEGSGYNNYAMLAIVVYLNDFNGGELFFPSLGIDYKANAGDLVFFPGTGKEYDHGVRPLLPGPTRYVTTGFGYHKNAESLKQAQYVFEDTKTGKFLESDPTS